MNYDKRSVHLMYGWGVIRRREHKDMLNNRKKGMILQETEGGGRLNGSSEGKENGEDLS